MCGCVCITWVSLYNVWLCLGVYIVYGSVQCVGVSEYVSCVGVAECVSRMAVAGCE